MIHYRKCNYCEQSYLVLNRYALVAKPGEWMYGLYATFCAGLIVWSFTEAAMWGCIGVGIVSVTVLCIVRSMTAHAERIGKLNADTLIAQESLRSDEKRLR